MEWGEGGSKVESERERFVRGRGLRVEREIENCADGEDSFGGERRLREGKEYMWGKGREEPTELREDEERFGKEGNG